MHLFGSIIRKFESKLQYLRMQWTVMYNMYETQFMKFNKLYVLPSIFPNEQKVWAVGGGNIH